MGKKLIVTILTKCQSACISVRKCLIALIFFLIFVLIYNSRKSKTPKIILFGNSFFDNPTWGLPDDTVNQSYFVAQNCPETNCIITNKRRFLESDSQFDAIVFHAPVFFSIKHLFPTTDRNPEQIYVFASLESPANTLHDFSDEFDLFNLTMTYRIDSDIWWPYGLLQDIETGNIIEPGGQQVIWKKPISEFELDPDVERQLIGKNKMAAWFVSHCHTISKREKLVEALERHFKIDIYGDCGPLRCPRFSTECDVKLDRDYKFYLSFENSLCVDYVTEKFFDMLDRNIVPVVYGGADYTRFAPPHSYINVRDFETITDLANYLKYLDENFMEYRKYFWWKKFYKRTNRSMYCGLCMKLNNLLITSGNRQIYPNIEKWWFNNTCENLQP